MEIHLHESILLLGLDDEKGKITSSTGTFFYYAFGAACLVDLVQMGKIRFEDQKVIVLQQSHTSNKVLNDI